VGDSLILYHNPMSRGRIAHWMLEETGAPYTVKLIDFEKQEHKTATFLAINPMGKLPALVHRGVVVTEAAAICAYLADAFPDARLAPSTADPARGSYLRWLFFGAGCLEPAIVDRMLERPAPSRTGAIGYGTLEGTLNTLEKALSAGPFILGQQFTAADVYVASAIGWGTMVKALQPRAPFQAYVARMVERPAHQRMVAQNEVYSRQLKSLGPSK
jgi:glutathione S-transferase